jgi:hypothetical protein
MAVELNSHPAHGSWLTAHSQKLFFNKKQRVLVLLVRFA